MPGEVEMVELEVSGRLLLSDYTVVNMWVNSLKITKSQSPIFIAAHDVNEWQLHRFKISSLIIAGINLATGETANNQVLF